MKLIEFSLSELLKDTIRKKNLTSSDYSNTRPTAYLHRTKNFVFRIKDYDVNIRLEDLATIGKLKGSDKEKLDLALQGDVKVNCTCLVGSTKIKLLDGSVREISSLKEGEEFWVYGCSKDGSFIPVKAKSLGETKVVNNTLLITLDNGKEIECTPDHRFMLRDGSYKEAQYLTPEDSLMPQYLSTNDKGYEILFDNKLEKWRPTHTFVSRRHKILGKNFYDKKEWLTNSNTKDKFLVTHHKDFSKTNNSPDNLEWMGNYEHWMYHAKLGTDRLRKTWNNWKDEDYYNSHVEIMRENGRRTGSENGRKTITKWNKENPELHSNNGKRVAEIHINKLKTDPDYKNRISRIATENIMGYQRRGITDSHREKLSNFMKDFNKKNEEKNTKRLISYNKDPEMKRKQGIGKIYSVFRKIEEKNIEITQESFLNHKYSSCPPIDKYFNNINEAINSFRLYNHRVKSIECKEYKSGISVYDINVPETSNFLLEAGVYVHNCPDFLYGGWRYIGTQLDYSTHIENRPPEVRNPNEVGTICKHIGHIITNIDKFKPKMLELMKKSRDAGYKVVKENTNSNNIGSFIHHDYEFIPPFIEEEDIKEILENNTTEEVLSEFTKIKRLRSSYRENLPNKIVDLKYGDLLVFEDDYDEDNRYERYLVVKNAANKKFCVCWDYDDRRFHVIENDNLKNFLIGHKELHDPTFSMILRDEHSELISQIEKSPKLYLPWR